MFLYPHGTIADYDICSYIHMVIGHMKAHKAINTTSVPLLTMHMFLYPHGHMIGHMKAHKAYISHMHMFLYPHGDRSYEAHKAITISVPLLTMHMFLYPHGDRSYEST